MNIKNILEEMNKKNTPTFTGYSKVEREKILNWVNSKHNLLTFQQEFDLKITDTTVEYDAILNIYPNEKYIIEAKVRSKVFKDYILEKKKYDSMIKNSEELGRKAIYLVFTPDYIVSWYIKDLNINWENRELSETTVNRDEGTINKEICYLKIEDSFCFIPNKAKKTGDKEYIQNFMLRHNIKNLK